MTQTQLEKMYDYVEDIFKGDETGHDFYHMKRVAQMAKTIGLRENADVFICEAAGLLHDIGDHKLFLDPLKEMKKMEEFLQSISLSFDEIEEIKLAIKDVSFSKGRVPFSLEGKIVQDADRLDALGAIGIARTFAYGGSRGKLLYDESDSKDTSIQHFYDKLLTLKELMHTSYAKKIAEERHEFMNNYLNVFFEEW